MTEHVAAQLRAAGLPVPAAPPRQTPAKPPPRPPKPPPATSVPPAPPASPDQAKTKPADKKPTAEEVATLLARSGIRWYASRASDKGLLQVKIVGVPEERLHELIHAAKELFPELRQY